MARILFDMDGTIADLYSVDNWLEDLNNERTRPYLNAEPMGDMALLDSILYGLQQMGHEVEIVSWSAMDASKEYNKRIRRVKCQWVKRYLPSIETIHVVKYGTPKKEFGYGCECILFDDNAEVRAAFEGKGTKGNTRTAYEPSDIIAVCMAMLKETVEARN